MAKAAVEVCVLSSPVFTSNRSFYPTTSEVHPVPVLIHPRDTSYVVTDWETE